jgi:hypothetical protein
MAGAGFEDDADGAPAAAPEEPSLQDLANSARFFGHELRGTSLYRLDLAALTAGPTRVEVGIGAGSGSLDTFRTSTALAGLLGRPPVEFPGDHGGFVGHPAEFAEVLRKVLADGPGRA